jgi:hypothetical protein
MYATKSAINHLLLVSLPCDSLIMIAYVSVSNMDARRMEFIPDQCFDLVLDKGNQSPYAVECLSPNSFCLTYAMHGQPCLTPFFVRKPIYTTSIR